jgi:hypothetical protein
MKKQGMRDKAESTTEIKINGISLTLRADKRGNKIKINYQIGDGRFRFNDTMLARF